METMGESKKRVNEENKEFTEKERRRSGGDTIAWLQDKSRRDAELKERELKEQKEEREFHRQEKKEERELLHKQLQLQLECQKQQQQQQNIMQQQLIAMVQQQQQQFQLMFGILKSKINQD